MSAITSFTGQYRFLSNFFIEPDGTHVEGEYQAAKCYNSADADYIRLQPPLTAKRLGAVVQLRAEWDDKFSIKIMRALVFRKFYDHPTLLNQLLRTGNAELIEGHTKDKFWGVYQDEGRNEMGNILMTIRKNILTYRKDSVLI